jgi:hypothetical protein
MEATLPSETIVTTQRLQVITGQKAVIILTAAGPSGRVVWGVGFGLLDTETVGSNPA